MQGKDKITWKKSKQGKAGHMKGQVELQGQL